MAEVGETTGQTRALSFTVFADYYQMYIEDAQPENDAPGDAWNDATLAHRVLALPGLVNVATARNMTVPVSAEVCVSAPEDELTAWDHVAEASLSAPSGCIVISSPIGTEAARLLLLPSTYRVRVYFGGLGTVSDDGLEGADHYRIVLWPAPYREPKVLRAWKP